MLNQLPATVKCTISTTIAAFWESGGLNTVTVNSVAFDLQSGSLRSGR